jgi:GrpB-like predicted nucleotidyltransferase (UPF0157 family)
VTDDESLQQAIDEHVSLRAYDPAWPALFDAERLRLLALFPGWLLDVRHIGSTAVPGMDAKPIIDILAGVASMAVADSLIDPLTREGYSTSAEFNATLPDRRWLMRHAQGRRTHHLHLVVLGEAAWRQRLHFRDMLRANRELAHRYLRLKQELALQHAADRELYTREKAEFVSSVSGDA